MRCGCHRPGWWHGDCHDDYSTACDTCMPQRAFSRHDRSMKIAVEWSKEREEWPQGRHKRFENFSKNTLLTIDMWKNNNEIIRIVMTWNTEDPHFDFSHDDEPICIHENPGKHSAKLFPECFWSTWVLAWNYRSMSRGFIFHDYFSHLGVCFNHPDLLLANGTRPHHIFLLVIRLM